MKGSPDVSLLIGNVNERLRTNHKTHTVVLVGTIEVSVNEITNRPSVLGLFLHRARATYLIDQRISS
jgi:hypothetical protein